MRVCLPYPRKFVQSDTTFAATDGVVVGFTRIFAVRATICYMYKYR